MSRSAEVETVSHAYGIDALDAEIMHVRKTKHNIHIKVITRCQPLWEILKHFWEIRKDYRELGSEGGLPGRGEG
jgi:hypothetical protein